MAKTKLYSDEDAAKAVQAYMNGTKLAIVCASFPQVPRRTITRMAKRDKDGVQVKKPGPAPILTTELEKDLQDWIVAMQRDGFPVSRDAILIKGNEMFHALYGNRRSTGNLKRGWLNRFLQRHPLLTTRSSQVIKRVRAEATECGLRIFFWELSKHSIERKLTADRIYNMDETGFAQNSKSKKVIAIHGSKNVWSKSVEASFHLTIVACVGADGFVVPPLFVLPGQRVNRDILNECSIDGSTVSVAPKGFMNGRLFLSWLEHFERSIPVSVIRPVVLVYDGYSSHYNDEIVWKAIELKIILVLLPANSTHLIQPLDIAVFKPFKTILKRQMDSFMIENSVTSFSKKEAIQIASRSWMEGVVEKKSNIVAGFKAGGIWPISFPTMQSRWNLFHDGGIDSKKIEVEPWITAREVVRSEILLLPAIIDRAPKRRKTLDVNNRLLTREQLNMYDD
jgi:hypothetical protein